jgi:L,D-transpeptidase ErfK/SrfK
MNTGMLIQEFMEIRPVARKAIGGRRRCLAVLLGWLSLLGCAEASTYPLPAAGQFLVGQLQDTRVREGETLLDIARRYSVGLDELEEANPGVDPWLPPVGQRVLIPSQHLLPNVPRKGIVVNLPELRLYYFPKAKAGEQRVVMTYPLGIGSEGRAIPVTLTSVIQKKIDPPWVVPASILAEHQADGDPLPKVVPPGPDNPLGRYALRLGLSSFLIHSTNHPYSVGMRISHGCLRMYPEDIEELFGKVAVGTPVRIIDQPYKAGWQGGVLYLETHPPLAESGYSSDTNLTPMVVALTNVVSQRLSDHAWQAAVRVASQDSGIPTPIFAEDAKRAQAAFSHVSEMKIDRHPWMVQVGVFQDRDKAQHVKRMMQSMNLPVEVSEAGENRLCRILVGPFPNRKEATDTADKISKGTGLDNFLVPQNHTLAADCRLSN